MRQLKGGSSHKSRELVIWVEGGRRGEGKGVEGDVGVGSNLMGVKGGMGGTLMGVEREVGVESILMGVEGKMGGTRMGAQAKMGGALPSPHCFDLCKAHTHPMLLGGSRGGGGGGVED